MTNKMTWKQTDDEERTTGWTYSKPAGLDWANVTEYRTGLGRTLIGYHVSAGRALPSGPHVEAAEFLPACAPEAARERAEGLLRLLGRLGDGSP